MCEQVKSYYGKQMFVVPMFHALFEIVASNIKTYFCIIIMYNNVIMTITVRF